MKQVNKANKLMRKTKFMNNNKEVKNIIKEE